MKRSFRAQKLRRVPVPRVALWARMSCSFGAKSTLKNSLIKAVVLNDRCKNMVFATMKTVMAPCVLSSIHYAPSFGKKVARDVIFL